MLMLVQMAFKYKYFQTNNIMQKFQVDEIRESVEGIDMREILDACLQNRIWVNEVWWLHSIIGWILWTLWQG